MQQNIIICRLCCLVTSMQIYLLRFILLVLLRYHLLHAVPRRRRGEDAELAQYPRDAVAGLCSDAEPVAQSVGLEPYFLDTGAGSDGIVGADDLQEPAVAGRPAVGRHHPVERGVRAAEPL